MNNQKLHNPKSHAPAVYIPCWLIQVPSKLLSHAAKLLYGRLSQWATTKCTVHRSIPQLAQETGMEVRTIERHLKELRNAGLIGTYQAKAGGINHYQFYDHKWMHLPINENLTYGSSHSASPLPPDKRINTPPTNMSVPPVKSGGPKIKRNKKKKDIFKEVSCASLVNKPIETDPLSKPLLTQPQQSIFDKALEKAVKEKCINLNNYTDLIKHALKKLKSGEAKNFRHATAMTMSIAHKFNDFTPKSILLDLIAESINPPIPLLGEYRNYVRANVAEGMAFRAYDYINHMVRNGCQLTMREMIDNFNCQS